MASSSSDNHRYEVFLSFRGEDTRNNFTSHLFTALKGHRFNVFHDTMLERGESVSSGLLEAIEGSKLSIVVFSKNYADSRWCLDELVKIMDCRRRSSHPQTVLPVFYDVEPSDVRNQKGEYAAAFANHGNNQDIHKVNNWKSALNEVGELSGLHLRSDSNGDEADFIRKIIKQVGGRLDQPYLNVAYYPVGIESHVQKLNDLLGLEANDIRIIAICGLGGIGKTTIAKALFNENRRSFDGSYFLADVRANAARPDGLITLQEKLISNVINKNVQKIYSCDQGIEVIKRRLWCRKVLIVLDDVDNIQQVKKLAINRSWLRQGSKVIITTRDKSCVSALDVKFYEPNPLGANSSLKLFSWHAFGEDYLKEGYEKLSSEVVDYAGGIPLVLETLGPYMRDFRTIEEWQEALGRLRMIPHDDVQKILELSYHSLGAKEKELFLDIACFFVGMDKEIVFHVLDEKAPGYYPKFEFKVLCNRCLVKPDDDRLSMHDMVRDMGREIVRQESLNDPGKRSRLFHPQDVLCVLRESLGTEAIESIFLELANSNEEEVDIRSFAKMSRLRMIHLKNIKLYGTYSSMRFMEKLKWLWWDGFPLTCIPPNLDMRNLVALHLQGSRLKQLWLGTKSLHRLRFLDVSHSYFLTCTPDFSGVIHLEKLLLSDCTCLGEIHNSIGCLQKLIVLDLKNCKRLTKVPLSFLQLKSLEDLNLSGCSKLFESTGFEASVSGLWHWFSSRLSWKPQPESHVPMFLLPNSLHGQNCLTRLNLKNCNLSDLPTAVGSLVSLMELNLKGNKFASLPAGIKYLKRLQWLKVNDCVELKSIQDLPRDMVVVNAENCPLLETIQVASNRQTIIGFSRNTKLIDNIFTNKARKASDAYSSFLKQGQFISKFNLLMLDCGKEEIPDWFKYQGEGPFIYFVVPQCTERKIQGWIVVAAMVSYHSSSYIDIIIGNVYNKTKDMHSVFVRFTSTDSLWMGYVELSKHGIIADGGDEIEIVFLGTAELRNSGLCLVYDEYEGFEVDDEQLRIQYSPDIHLYGEDEDDGINPIDKYISPVMKARIKPMLDVLRDFDDEVVLMIVKEIEDGGGAGIHCTDEHKQIYHTIANAFYIQFVHPCGGLQSSLFFERLTLTLKWRNKKHVY